MQIDALLDDLAAWAVRRSDVVAVGIAGSHARGTARPDSDVDIILIVENAVRYLEEDEWLESFGAPRSVTDEDWGLLQSRRVHYANGIEVEFGIADRRWAAIEPVDQGTATVVAGGLRILYDRDRMLEALLERLK